MKNRTPRWLAPIAITCAAVSSALGSTIEEDFANPPAAAKPYVWWHWMSDNVSEDGIDKDLAAMKACGVGGVTVCDVGSTTGIDHSEIANSPWTVDFLGDKWWALMKHAVQRGGELGFDMGMHNCGGWSASGGPWITPELSMQSLVWSKTTADGATGLTLTLPKPKEEAPDYQDIAVLAVLEKGSPQQAIEMTDKLDKDGKLAWSATAGRWTIYRFGHASSGKTMHPMPDRFNGLEADKLSAKAAQVHLQHVIDDAKQHVGDDFGKSFKHILFDSYEARDQSWTTDYRDQFKKRRGYDPLPYLPILDDPKTYDADVVARFQYDAARTTAELFKENDFDVYHKMLKAAGVTMCLEPYKGPFDTIACTDSCDVPMGEYWTFEKKRVNRNVVAAARALGRNIIGAESITGRPMDSQWNDDPAMLKPYIDRGFCDGVNQVYLHEWTLQPFDDSIVPGMTCGYWGTHFGRNQTWFEPGKAFFAYLARCSAMLQRGEPVVDYVTLGREDDTGDAITDAMLQDCKVENGKLIVPSGRLYELLVLQKSSQMLPETARKLKQLINDGASVLGPKPAASPSLTDYPRADPEVAAIGDEVWGTGKASSNTQKSYGKGTIYFNLSPADVLKAKSIQPDVDCGTATVLSTHRRDKDSDIFFVANATSQPTDASVNFRVIGKSAMLWDAVSGKSAMAKSVTEKDGRTLVDLHLPANGSIFVLFELAKHISPTRTDSTPQSMPVTGPWTVTFTPGRGAPSSIAMDKLGSWSGSSDAGVKYFSGTGTYSTTFTFPQNPALGRHVLLDLGKLRSAAMVKLNGHELGAVWCPIDGLDVTDALQAGDNHLEVAVSNTWKNRLIGDEQQPADLEWGKVATFNRLYPEGRPLVKFPDWLVNHQPRPSKDRLTFTTWNYFDKDSKLDEAGLLGPVVLKSEGAP